LLLKVRVENGGLEYLILGSRIVRYKRIWCESDVERCEEILLGLGFVKIHVCEMKYEE
jgi:hypothetical protein